MSMTKYEKIARTAVANYLAPQREPVSLWSVSCVAEKAVRDAGKKKELYKSLYDYEALLPSERQWHSRWLKAQGGTGDGMLMAIPPNWKEGQTNCNELILGQGKLVAYNYTE